MKRPTLAEKTSDLKTLTDELNAKKVDVLLVFGGANPAYSAPADIDFAGSLKAATDAGKFTFYLGTHVDETSVLCEWQRSGSKLSRNVG